MAMLNRKVINNIKDLREYLDADEALWTERHQEAMGDFDLQEVYIPYYTLDGEFMGLGPPEASMATTSGIELDAPKAWLMERHAQDQVEGDADES
jgi:hypothetical protein